MKADYTNSIVDNINKNIKNVDDFNKYLCDLFQDNDISIDIKNKSILLLLQNTKVLNISTIFNLLQAYKKNNQIDIYNHLKDAFEIVNKNNIELFHRVTLSQPNCREETRQKIEEDYIRLCNFDKCLLIISELDDIIDNQKNKLISLFLKNTKILNETTVAYLFSAYAKDNKIKIYDHLDLVFKIAEEDKDNIKLFYFGYGFYECLSIILKLNNIKLISFFFKETKILNNSKIIYKLLEEYKKEYQTENYKYIKMILQVIKNNNIKSSDNPGLFNDCLSIILELNDISEDKKNKKALILLNNFEITTSEIMKSLFYSLLKSYAKDNKIKIYDYFEKAFQIGNKNNIELFNDADCFNYYLLYILKLNNINVDQKNELISFFFNKTKFINKNTIVCLLKLYNQYNQISIYDHLEKIFQIAKEENIELFNDSKNFNIFLLNILKLNNINVDQKNELILLFLENTKFINKNTIVCLLKLYNQYNQISIYDHLEKIFQIAKEESIELFNDSKNYITFLLDIVILKNISNDQQNELISFFFNKTKIIDKDAILYLLILYNQYNQINIFDHIEKIFQIAKEENIELFNDSKNFNIFLSNILKLDNISIDQKNELRSLFRNELILFNIDLIIKNNIENHLICFNLIYYLNKIIIYLNINIASNSSNSNSIKIILDQFKDYFNKIINNEINFNYPTFSILKNLNNQNYSLEGDLREFIKDIFNIYKTKFASDIIAIQNAESEFDPDARSDDDTDDELDVSDLSTQNIPIKEKKAEKVIFDSDNEDFNPNSSTDVLQNNKQDALQNDEQYNDCLGID